MKILITGAASLLAQEIIIKLDTSYTVRLIDDCPPPEKLQNTDWIQGSLTDLKIVQKAVQNIDMLIHTGEAPPTITNAQTTNEKILLDLATRGTHVLCTAAIEAGIKGFIYGSTLDIFASYPDTTYITEMHKPLPSTTMAQMARYLGELICKEFVREHMITGAVLRLGKLVLEEEVVGQQPDLMWVDRRDAAQAFCAALALDNTPSFQWVGRWHIYHICAPIANPKFLISTATAMGYEPQYIFPNTKGL